MPTLLDRALNIGEAKKFKSYEQRVKLIGAFEAELELDSDGELRERMDVLRERAREDEALEELLPECFALVREAGRRTLAMRHFDVQLIGGMALHDGCIAEMKTGEGKTLAATLAVVLNSLAIREEEPPPGTGGSTRARTATAPPRSSPSGASERASTWSRSTTTSRDATRNGWRRSTRRSASASA